ncbi:MAG TPA: hypothetical protein PK198_26510, partial [Saprospiraceae bacterium]|nr:hypothetical protein [Saprospiraceae bacterium]
MKQILTILMAAAAFLSFGQSNQADFENLVQLGEFYSKNIDCTGDDFIQTVDRLRTRNLNHIVDALIAVGKADQKLLSKEFLSKPSDQELKYWYVLREIHYNLQPDNANPKTSVEVARQTLEDDIDHRWLLDNYYYRINIGVAKMFNDKDLSKTDIRLDEYGLKTDTEKATLFFSTSNALIQRFQVLKMIKNYDQLLEYVARMPTFNGRPYYEYTAFGFEDFEWIGYNKTESYKTRHLGSLYSALAGHMSALAEKGKNEELRDLYFNSILSMPEYFKYSGGLEKNLQELYKELKTPAQPAGISMLGLKIGDSPKTVEQIKLKVDAREKNMIKFKTSDGNDFSVTVQKGKIVYMENDWLQNPKATQPLYSDFRFGHTTLREIRARFGTNGFVHQNRRSFT